MQCKTLPAIFHPLTVQFLSHEPENEITLTAFRLLTMDLLALFHVMNEGTINVLG
jgi:phosphatidylinositol-binding clathrin assembly protein